MTVLQKRLKSLTLSYLDKLIAYVEKLKDAGASTSMDQMLHAQRVRVNQTVDPDVLLQVSDGHTLAKYLARVDALEESLDDDQDPHDAAARERESEALDSYLERIGTEIDETRVAVTKEVGEHALASTGDRGNTFLAALASHLEADGARVSLVTAMFKKKSFTELLAARKKRKRWLRTPAGKMSVRKSKIRAKRPHTIDRQRSKVVKQAHKVYKY